MHFQGQAMHYGLGGIQSAPAVIEPEGDEEKGCGGAAAPQHPLPLVYPLQVPSYSKTSVTNMRPSVLLHSDLHLQTKLQITAHQLLSLRRMVPHPICVKPKIVKSLPFKKRQMTAKATAATIKKKMTTKINVRHALPPLKLPSGLPMGRPLVAPPNLPKIPKGVAMRRKGKGVVPTTTTSTSSS